MKLVWCNKHDYSFFFSFVCLFVRKCCIAIMNASHHQPLYMTYKWHCGLCQLHLCSDDFYIAHRQGSSVHYILQNTGFL